MEDKYIVVRKDDKRMEFDNLDDLEQFLKQIEKRDRAVDFLVGFSIGAAFIGLLCFYYFSI